MPVQPFVKKKTSPGPPNIVAHIFSIVGLAGKGPSQLTSQHPTPKRRKLELRSDDVGFFQFSPWSSINKKGEHFGGKGGDQNMLAARNSTEMKGNELYRSTVHPDIPIPITNIASGKFPTNQNKFLTTFGSTPTDLHQPTTKIHPWPTHPTTSPDRSPATSAYDASEASS